ncbi:serine/threonine protein kinase [Haliangium ochraceum]|uniref:non-specific serine/threonine protein kinase n=1 Tax=Haliangium ochraceum (strain DSM 14365 / JCM 11303 / SMP-2) TaxID=502025 RepID=D0LHP1_HALO1|nr:serine/threonine-protein kinase [Haliangium ochraceum]ACY12903.1 serine/threonine protein kinase [Haliangium ochraceum DSM 14365]
MSSPENFGPYEVYERLGIGGMATVHRAKERGIEDFERIVALKRLLPHLAEDASFVRSFVREAKLASMLQHAHIVQLYELGRVGQVLFISMEYIEGCDIRRILRRARKIAGPPVVPVFLSLMTQLCDALDYAHSRADSDGNPLGLVHRDVSPSNVLVTKEGHVKVIDFGIAKAQSSHLKTQTGRIKGKLAYMAPEAVRGNDLDARSDIFSAGVIAHELLTARPLFSSKNEYQTLQRVQRAEVEPPSKYNPDCPPELDSIVLRALSRDEDKRWQTAGEMRDALEHMRMQLGYSATTRDVASWLEWAFALDEPPSAEMRRSRRHTSSSFAADSETIPSGMFSPVSFAGRATPRPSPADVVSLPGIPEAEPEVQVVPLGGDDPEDHADVAWGSLEAEDGRVVLEAIPDVSAKYVAPPAAVASSGTIGGAQPRAATAASAATASAAAAAPTQARSRTGMLLVAVLAIAALGVGAFVALRGEGETQAPAPVTTAVLKFAVEPTDARIEVQGYGTHEGVPLRLEVDAPATYRVQIQREGYTSYVSEIELEGGEIRSVQVVLETGHSDQAAVAVRSTPSEQRVMLDGELLEQRTPVTLEMSPGAHTLVIVDDAGGELWRHEFDASASTQYEFHPTLSEREDTEERSHRRHRDDDDDDDRERRRRRQSQDDERGDSPEVAAAAPQPSAQSPGQPLAIQTPTASVLDSLAKVEPPKMIERKQPAKPVMVSSNKVERRSGSLPRLEAMRRDLPERVRALLCIDTSGRVSSVKLYDIAKASVRKDLEGALSKWRYAPYREAGKAVPACFGITFRTVLN